MSSESQVSMGWEALIPPVITGTNRITALRQECDEAREQLAAALEMLALQDRSSQTNSNLSLPLPTAAEVEVPPIPSSPLRSQPFVDPSILAGVMPPSPPGSPSGSSASQPLPDINLLCAASDEVTPHGLRVFTAASLEDAVARNPTFAAQVGIVGRYSQDYFDPTTAPHPDISQALAWETAKRRLVWLSPALMVLLELGSDREAAMERMNRSQSMRASAIRANIAGMLRSFFALGDLRPMSFINLIYHDTQPTHFCLVRFSPCVFEDLDGDRFWAYLSDFDTQSPEYVERVKRNIMLEHLALKYTPTLVTLVDADGAVLSQNAASVEALGVHASAANNGGGDGGSAHLGGGAPPPQPAHVDYLKELFTGEQAALDEMFEQTAAGQVFKRRLQISSPTLLHWMTSGGPALKMWHEVQVARARDAQSHAPVYIIAQVDVTEMEVAKRQVQQLQAQQQRLLSAILPQQVIDTLLKPIDEVGFHEDGSNKQHTSHSACNRPLFLSALQGDTLPDTLKRRDREASLNTRLHMRQRDFCNTTLSRLSTFHDSVTVLFSDIQGFTSMSEQLHPADVMAFLNNLYSALDQIVEEQGPLGVYKVETIGDSYMVCGGLFHLDAKGNKVLGGNDPEHAAKTVVFARAMAAAAARIMTPLGQPVMLRIGVHSGSCMSGIVGQKMPRFCLFGDTVNMSSRMESTGVAGKIHVSQATRDLLPNEKWRATGGVHAKGKGFLQTYFLE